MAPSLPPELILDIFAHVAERPARLLNVPPLRWPHRNRALLRLTRVCALWARLAQRLLFAHVELGRVVEDADPTLDVITYDTRPPLQLLLNVLRARPELADGVHCVCLGSGQDSQSMDPLRLGHAPTVRIVHPDLAAIAELVACCPHLHGLDIHVYHTPGKPPVAFTPAEERLLRRAEAVHTLRYAQTCRWRHAACAPTALFQLVAAFASLRSLAVDALGASIDDAPGPLPPLADMSIVGAPPARLTAAMDIQTLTLVHPPAHVRVPESVRTLVVHELQTPLDLSHLTALRSLSFDPPSPRRGNAKPGMTSQSAVQQTLASLPRDLQLVCGPHSSHSRPCHAI
ncbi:hypothetical protein AURDEDRAFT_116957 [Auricularia subglabra TFB-10046 SS5]|uniref:Uncharacterized protein n=1 Tax=Auricularia subglabra (strain TFB-10046 / SS5) TaxID=717982 RepID=J0CZH9_AURST|nr:hypothetical protein AURDEDRAFT_116957 [Auricularia subglabra TFB-10046 SS5]